MSLQFVVMCLIVILAYTCYQNFHREVPVKPAPRTLINDSIEETVEAAERDGWIPCPGDCLKLATPGWQHKQVKGFRDSDVWFTFRDSRGWRAFTQHHVGHIIETHPDSAAQDVGICTICHGTGWVRKP